MRIATLTGWRQADPAAQRLRDLFQCIQSGTSLRGKQE
jgi:hypothetical protein